MTFQDWTRGPMWPSAEARRTWAPRIEAAQAAWKAAERQSVVKGLRSSALLVVAAEELPELSRWVGSHGLSFVVLASEAMPTTYSSVSASGTGAFRVAVFREPGLGADWLKAWQASDNDAIGTLLGFPPCCRRFFQRVWVDGEKRDTTLHMATVEGPHEANILLRWAGVRLVSHLPCSGDCQASAEIGRANLALMGPESAGVVRELLSLPVTYSATHGGAEILTPHFRMTAATDYTKEREERRRVGSDTPPVVWESPVWEDNGFIASQPMLDAHAVVSQAARTAGLSGTVIDLGCGDGRLINLLAEELGFEGVGVDFDPGRIERGRQRYPGLRLYRGTIEGLTPGVDGAFLMPGRLVEMTPEQATKVRDALRGSRLVVYAYGDWLTSGGLPALAQRAGLTLTSSVFRGPGAEAALAEVAGGSPD